MAEDSEYELMRLKNIEERQALFSTLFRELKVELKELSKPLRKSLPEKTPCNSQVRSAPRQRHSIVAPERRSRRIRRRRRLKRRNDYIYDDDKTENMEEDDDDDEYSNDDNDFCDIKRRVIVCFPCQSKFRTVDTNNVIDIWEENSSEEDYEDDYDEEYSLSQKRVSRFTADVAIVLSPEEVTEEDLQNVAQKSGGKTYSKEFGTSCHQCRQKTLDTKTMCRSGHCVGVRGQFCGPCLKNRYGESAEKALKDPDWSCPPCRGLCNCSICRTREGKRPTGILVPFIKSEGYGSVKEYLQFQEEEN